MPPPLGPLASAVGIADASLRRRIATRHGEAPLQFVLYDLLRREQAAAAGRQPARSEVSRILDFTQAAFGDLVGLLIGRIDALLDTLRDGEWTLRDVLRHAIAVELRYAAQVEYSATRGDGDPLGIPSERLPCDRLAPPEPEFADARDAGITRILELLGVARTRSDTLVDRVDDRALGRPSLWGTFEIDVRMRLHQGAVHLSETAVQIEKILGPDALGTEARRIIRRCCIARGSHERWSDPRVRSALDDDYRAIRDM